MFTEVHFRRDLTLALSTDCTASYPYLTIPKYVTNNTVFIMAESEVNSPAVVIDQSADVEMGTPAEENDVEVVASGTVENGDGLPFAADDEEDVKIPVRQTYIDSLASPVVQLNITEGDNTTVLSAHEALLKKSPWFAAACAQFGPSTAVS